MGAIIACMFASPTIALAHDGRPAIIVELDRAMVIALPKGRHKTIISDPTIVRLYELPDRARGVLTGTAFGATRMTVLDNQGNVLRESQILVKEPDEPVITIQRGHDARNIYFDCPQRCEPRLQLGEADKEFSDITGQIGAHNGSVAAPAAREAKLPSKPVIGPHGGL